MSVQQLDMIGLITAFASNRATQRMALTAAQVRPRGEGASLLADIEARRLELEAELKRRYLLLSEHILRDSNPAPEVRAAWMGDGS